MAGRVLLDTSVVIALFAGDANVAAHLLHTDEVFVPSTVIGELYYGARKSGRAEANLVRVEQFAAESVVLDCSAETAYCYGVTKNALRAMGRPVPENDIWIAAAALQHGLVLATRDRHLSVIAGLALASW